MTFEEWWKQTNGVGVMRKKDAQFWFHKGAEAQRERADSLLLQLRRYRAHHELLMKMQDNGTGCNCELCKQTDELLRSAPIEGETQ